MNSLPIDPNAELFRWGPVLLRYFYQCDFDLMMGDGHYARVYPEYIWPISIALHTGNRLCWVNNRSQVWKMGTKTFLDLVIGPRHDEVRNAYNKAYGILRSVHDKIDTSEFSKMSDADFLAIWSDLHQKTIDFFIHGLIPELSNYGSDNYLENKLREYINEDKEVLHAMEVLTAPEELSFYQQEEIDLSETKDIAAHQKQYYWLKNAYSLVQVLDVTFFEERKKNIVLQDLRKHLSDHLDEVKKAKEVLKKQYNLSEEVMKIAKGVAYGVVWQDDRKKAILQNLHYKNVLLDEMVRRIKSVSKDDLLNFTNIDIAEMLNGKDYSIQIEDRRKGFGEIIWADKIEMLDSKRTLAFWDIYAEEKAAQGTTEARGIVACKAKDGKLQGKIRVLLNPHQVDILQEGEILVAPMTSPEYIFAMRKASAIVTDNGGLTSHAAIVSRELKKPCLVGTKIATQIFKDGDVVEIDTVAGVVRLTN